MIAGIGGENGWYSFPLAWAARGWVDRLVGGVGLNRGRRDQHNIGVGEALDFWRVEELVPRELLRLRAEMKLPGLAWLELAIRHRPDSGDSPGVTAGNRGAPASSTPSVRSSIPAGSPGTCTGGR